MWCPCAPAPARRATELLHLDRLTVIPDAGPSHGANLLANPTLDLTMPKERESQVDDWLQQIAMDSGISGMEELLVAYHAAASKPITCFVRYGGG